MKELIVLGPENDATATFYQNVKAAVAAMGENYPIRRISDPTEIMMFGVTLTPALVIDDVPRIIGRVADVEEIQRVIAMVEIS